ncbi:MAG TPA: molybdopterin cofactor-binding domain-containing protein, partial [Anaerolineales bacterium]|nr:molybdopterin cofactor-binding domain-containing protein [Anaerolineales bacterium]
IKVLWSREESIIGHHKRHPFILRTKWGATKDGRVIAAKAEVLGDAGAYNYTSNKVLGNATLTVAGPYAIENVYVDAYAVYTNHVPGGAFRGFGGPQGAFAAEMQMNRLAEALGMDPVAIRLKNVITDGVDGHTQAPLPSPVTMDRVIADCARHSGWTEQPGWQRPAKAVSDRQMPVKRGLGYACGYKNVGFSFGFDERNWATVELHGEAEIERVVVHQAGTDVGQGAHTLFRQVAAEALDVPEDMIELAVADTAITGDSGSTSASRMTYMSGNAIIGAAKLAMEKWQDEERPAIAEYKYSPVKTFPMDHETGKSENPNVAYGYVAEVVELEVDTETGEVRILKVVCADDVGKALNPQQVVGQIEGAVVQAGGYVMLENFIQQDGNVVTDKLSTYLIPTILDVPEMVDSVILEYADPTGPFGARGMAEMPYIPLAPAITAALHDATGVWFHDFPLTPERVLRGLGKI